MKVIFLDIDGVLNGEKSRTRCAGYIGIDSDKLLRLKRIVEQTGAKIVLISTWKTGWCKLNKLLQDELANYLDRKFKKFGLEAYDKTPNAFGQGYLSRGEGILYYLYENKVESFVILDDLQFDYDGCNLTDKFVKTNGATGIADEDVERAIRLLK